MRYARRPRRQTANAIWIMRSTKKAFGTTTMWGAESAIEFAKQCAVIERLREQKKARKDGEKSTEEAWAREEEETLCAARDTRPISITHAASPSLTIDRLQRDTCCHGRVARLTGVSRHGAGGRS